MCEVVRALLLETDLGPGPGACGLLRNSSCKLMLQGPSREKGGILARCGNFLAPGCANGG